MRDEAKKEEMMEAALHCIKSAAQYLSECDAEDITIPLHRLKFNLMGKIQDVKSKRESQNRG